MVNIYGWANILELTGWQFDVVNVGMEHNLLTLVNQLLPKVDEGNLASLFRVFSAPPPPPAPVDSTSALIELLRRQR